MVRRGLLRRLVPAVVAVACLTPVITSALDVGRGWVPASDTAIIATRSRDVFSDQSPLLGQPSTAGAMVDEQVHHPGPLEYWAIAAGQRVVDHPAVSLTVITLVNVAAVLAILWWVRALAGSEGLAFAAVPIVTTLWSLRGETLVDPLNPLAALLPFAAFLVSLVAVGRGRTWALVTAVVAGSWAAQAHLSITGLVVAAAVTVAAGAGLQRLRAARTDRRRVDRRPLVVALAVLVVCWAGPIVDVVASGGGNVRALIATGGSVPAQPGSVGAAVDRSVQALSWRPVWAQAGATVPHLLATPSTSDRVVVAALWLGGVAAAVATRHRAPAIGWAFAVATVVILTGTALLSRLPGSFFNVFQTGNYLWLWPAGALLWSATAGGLLVLVRQRLAAGRALPDAVLALPLCAAVAVALASVVQPSHRPVQRDGPTYIRALGDQLAASLDAGATYGVDLSFDLTEQAVDSGLVHELERRGYDLRVPQAFAPSFGPERATGLAGTDGTLVVDVGRQPPPRPAAGAELVASYRPPPELARRHADAEEAVADRIDRRGGLGALLYPELGIDEPDTTLDFVRGAFLGLSETGLLGPDVVAWPETRALAEVRALATSHANVHLVPAP